MARSTTTAASLLSSSAVVSSPPLPSYTPSLQLHQPPPLLSRSPHSHTLARAQTTETSPPSASKASSVPMAPLLLLFLLGGLCALFSLTSSSRAGARKCEDDVKEPRCRDGCVPEEAQQQQGKKQAPARRADPEKDLGIVFSTFDHDGDGFISAVELEESLRRLGIAVSADEAAAMVARVDANSDGLIDIIEFRELYDSIPKKRKHHQHPAADFSGAAREVPVEGDDEEAEGEGEEEEEEEEEERDLREAFDVFDGNKDGLISAEELGTVLGSLGLRRQGNGRAAVADCRDMIRLVDSDGDGMVSFEEFKRMMTVVKA